MNAMPARKTIFGFAIAYSRSALLIALCSLPFVLSAGIANAEDLDIDTGNVQMSLGQDGVFINTAPGYPVRTNGNFNRNLNRNWNKNTRIYSPRASRVLKCRNVRQRRHSSRGGAQVYSSATTTICN
jgi:hypothetical protein